MKKNMLFKDKKEKEIDSDFLSQSFLILHMSCSSCAASVESALKAIKGVKKATVSIASASVLVQYNKKQVCFEEMKTKVRSIGYDLIAEDHERKNHQEIKKRAYQKIKQNTLGAAILSLPVFVLGMFFTKWQLGNWISMILSFLVLAYFGKGFFIHAWKKALNGKASMDTLVALSTGIAFIFSFFTTLYPSLWLDKGIEAHVYYETSVVIITLISLGKLLEERAKSHVFSAIKKLMALQPKSIRIVLDGKEVDLPACEMQPGLVFVIHPGEIIPADGRIIQGNSYVDESMLTGEALALQKEKGDKVLCGTLNKGASFHMISDKVGENTLLSEIIKKVQQTQNNKSPIEKTVDKITGVFVPVVVLLSLISFVVWILIGGKEVFFHGLLVLISVLVVSCPCALGLATPTAIMVGLGKAMENNILVKGTQSLEMGSKVDVLILDKTGTITKGSPVVTEFLWDSESSQNYSYKQILLSIASLSEHPLAQALIFKLKNEGITPSVAIKNFEETTGKGLKAITFKSETYLVGSETFMNEHFIYLNESLGSKAIILKGQAKTLVCFANEKKILAILAIIDEIKPTSQRAVQSLQNRGIEIYMLTGDNQQSASYVARQVGIKHFVSDLMPWEKADFIKELQAKGKIVAMAGDGINDAQALSQADVSIAMGKGSDIAMDIADITLTTSDLMAIPKAFNLSKKIQTGIRQNLFWAFIYNLIGIPIAAGVLYPINGFLLNPMIAAMAMALSSLSVLANSLRLKKIDLKANLT